MTPRLTSGVRVSALIRRVDAAGGSAAVLARGDAGAGAVLVLTLERGQATLWERGFGPDGRPALVATGPADGDESALTDYWRRRRARDPDLWVIELNVPDAKRLAAETILGD